MTDTALYTNNYDLPKFETKRLSKNGNIKKAVRAALLLC